MNIDLMRLDINQMIGLIVIETLLIGVGAGIWLKKKFKKEFNKSKEN